MQSLQDKVTGYHRGAYPAPEYQVGKSLARWQNADGLWRLKSRDLDRRVPYRVHLHSGQGAARSLAFSPGISTMTRFASSAAASPPPMRIIVRRVGQAGVHATMRTAIIDMQLRGAYLSEDRAGVDAEAAQQHRSAAGFATYWSRDDVYRVAQGDTRGWVTEAFVGEDSETLRRLRRGTGCCQRLIAQLTTRRGSDSGRGKKRYRESAEGERA